MKGLKTFSDSLRGEEFYEYRYEHKYQALIKLKFSIPLFSLFSELIYADYLRVIFIVIPYLKNGTSRVTYQIFHCC